MGCKQAPSRSPQATDTGGCTIQGNLFYISALFIDVLFFPEEPTGVCGKTMAARIVHFGADNCCRLLVLEHAGYEIDHCSSVVKLGLALTTEREADAVVITEDPEAPRREAIALVRSRCAAPLILFQTAGSGYEESDFDLVIPALTSTHEWLEKIGAIIERSRSMMADSKSVSEQSAALRQKAAAARLKSALEHERLVRQRSKIDELTRQHLEKPTG